jgi:cobaltochelatase CobS
MTSEQTAAAAVRISGKPEVVEAEFEVVSTVQQRAEELSAAHSKDTLIAAWFALTGGKGDTARTSKEEYAARLARFGDQTRVADALAGVGNGASARPSGPMLPNAGAELARLIQGIAGGAVNEERVRAIVAESLTTVEPREVRVVRPDAAPVTLAEHTHAAFPKVLKLVAAGVNVMLKGPAACGKTHLAEQIARALGREFGTLHCTAGASEAQLLGYLLPTGASGAFEFHPAQFAQLYEKGNSLFLLDEIDRGDANMLAVLNGALANGHLHIPQSLGKPAFERGKDAAIIAAANTFGTGADALYVGANQLDAATLSRFYVVEMDYDRALEKRLAGAHSELLQWVWTLRERAQALKLRRVVSTRMVQMGAAALDAGIEWAEVRRDLLAGWTADELSKVGQ